MNERLRLKHGSEKGRSMPANQVLSHDEARNLALNCLVREYDDLAQFRSARGEDTLDKGGTLGDNEWHGGSQEVFIDDIETGE